MPLHALLCEAAEIAEKKKRERSAPSLLERRSVGWESCCSRVWTFLGNEEVRERGNSNSGAIKKHEISRTSLPVNLHFSV